MEPSTSSSSARSPSADTDSLLQALATRGWCFGDIDQVKALIAAQLSLHGDSRTDRSIESELLNMDLRSIGGKCLPDPSLLRKTSHLQGPKVLQASSVRDISRSTAESSGNSDSHRLLRLKLTDGYSEITAIEYSHVPSISEDVIPGTKQNRAEMHNGIICLKNKVITILGGIVHSLYDEWQMKSKYLVHSLATSRMLHESAEGPPPIREAPNSCSFTENCRSSSNHSGSSLLRKGESSKMVQTSGLQNSGPTMNTENDDAEVADIVDKSQEKPASTDTRLKVTASIPLQNQAAAQKLLQKQGQADYSNLRSRGQRHRSKGKEEESPLFTLDEWEKRKTGVHLQTTDEFSNTNQDEDLARQLQRQFDLEDIHDQKDPRMLDAEDIKKSMFNFKRDDSGAFTGNRSRGRGRGRRSRGVRVRG